MFASNERLPHRDTFTVALTPDRDEQKAVKLKAFDLQMVQRRRA